MKYLFKIIGIPGCGKSTIIRKLQKEYDNIKISKEQLYTPRDLTELQSNPMQNATPFQEKMMGKWLQINREEEKENSKDNEILLEHTPVEMIEFFTAAYKLAGYITDYGFDCIRNKYDYYARKPNDCGYIYILCPPEVAIKNMKLRDREGEGSITPAVLDTINHFILMHHDNNVVGDAHNKLKRKTILLRYRENDYQTNALHYFIESYIANML